MSPSSSPCRRCYGRRPQLISLAPGTAAALPAAAGSVGFPNAFYPTNSAAPARQGAVK